MTSEIDPEALRRIQMLSSKIQQTLDQIAFLESRKDQAEAEVEELVKRRGILKEASSKISISKPSLQ